MKTFLKLALSLFLFPACGSAAITTWSGKIYTYQVNALAFERKQNNEAIAYNSIQANGMLCMTPQDFLDFVNTYVVTPSGGTKVTTPTLPPLLSPKAAGN